MAYHAEILLGKIIKSYGFDGAVIVRLEKAFERKVPEMESVFLEIEGKPVPFIISSCEVVDNSLIRIVFDGYDSFEKINEFIGCKVFLTSAVEKENSDNYPDRLKGYKIKTSDNDLLGTILEIIENPGQILLTIRTVGGNEILVPLHDDFIINVDNRGKIITMNLPEGLKDLNNP